MHVFSEAGASKRSTQPNPSSELQMELAVAQIDMVYSQHAFIRLVAFLNKAYPPPNLDPIMVRASVTLNEIVRERLVGPKRPHQVQKQQHSQPVIQVRLTRPCLLLPGCLPPHSLPLAQPNNAVPCPSSLVLNICGRARAACQMRQCKPSSQQPYKLRVSCAQVYSTLFTTKKNRVHQPETKPRLQLAIRAGGSRRHQGDDALQQDCGCWAPEAPSEPQWGRHPGRRDDDSPGRGCGSHLPGGSLLGLQCFHTVLREQRSPAHPAVHSAVRYGPQRRGSLCFVSCRGVCRFLSLVTLCTCEIFGHTCSLFGNVQGKLTGR